MLGFTQILVSSTVNLVILLSAGALAGWFSRHPGWAVVQRYLMGTVLAGLAVRLAFEPRKVA